MLKEKGQVVRVNCKSCGRLMFKWQRPKEIDAAYPFPFDKLCGICLTEEDINFYKMTGGFVMEHGKQLTGVFCYNSETKTFNKFTFEAEEGVMGNIYIPKYVRGIPSKIVLHGERKVGNSHDQ